MTRPVTRPHGFALCALPRGAPHLHFEYHPTPRQTRNHAEPEEILERRSRDLTALGLARPVRARREATHPVPRPRDPPCQLRSSSLWLQAVRL
eukprot:4374120-Prymnesium_polylepis.1